MTIGATEAPTITQSKTLNEQPTRRQTHTNVALVNPQHKNVSNPDRQMMSQQGSKITILHVERNGIPVDMHRQQS